MFFANATVEYFNVKFTSMPLDDFLFLIAFLRPILCDIIFLIEIVSLSSRIDSFHKIVQKENHLKVIAKLFNKTSSIIKDMNQLYATNFMTSLIDLLLISLVTTFLGYDIIVHSLTKTDAILMLAGVSYMIIAGFVCFSILIAASQIECKKRKIIAKINDIKLRKSSNMHKFYELSIDYLEYLPTKLSCGLFILNKSHIFVILSSFFSYLIVMVQFDFIYSK